MPTLFGLLNFDYQSKFFGLDVLKPNYKPRAFIATYQDLGLIKNDVLTILSPKQEIKQFQLKRKDQTGVSPDFQIHYDEIPLNSPNKGLIDQTISYYQSASYILKEKKYQIKDLASKNTKLYAKIDN